jgi:predicted site-specific integrase-resolvase
MAAPPTLGESLAVKRAAEFLGVSPSTLRNRDRAGKLRPYRHPPSRYRFYRRAGLEAILRSAARRGRADG